MNYIVDYTQGYRDMLKLDECQKIVIQPLKNDLIVSVFDGKKPRGERLVRTLLRVERILVQVE